MKYHNKLSLVLMIILYTLVVGCSPKITAEEKIVNDYYNLLAQDKWDEAYQLLSTSTQEKFTLEEYVAWAELADSIKEPYESKIIKGTRVTDFGEKVSTVSNTLNHYRDQFEEHQ